MDEIMPAPTAGINATAMEEGEPSSINSAHAEEGRRRRVRSAQRRALRALLPCDWRYFAASVFYITSVCCVFSMASVASGESDARNWAFVRWLFIASLIILSAIWFGRIVHLLTWRLSQRRQRIPRGALEARLQLRHPGIELGRLRLLLVDRDFTGEDYQALLDLDENNEAPSRVGASEGEIRRNPSFLIREPAPDNVAKPRNCTICLYPFKPRERVRIIPCLHQFHTECIDPWLRQNAICPVCKFPAVG